MPEAELMSLQLEISKFVDSKIKESHFKGVGGKRIHYAMIEGRKDLPPIVVSEGLGESFQYYYEFIYDLYRQADHQQALFILDLRGQGFSERLSPYDGVIHVEKFENYVTDLQTFLETIVQPQYAVPPRVLAHSTGGLIALKLLSEKPDYAEKVVFVTPLFGFNYGQLPDWVMTSLTWLLDSVGYREKFIPFRQKKSLPAFTGNRLTSSEVRFANIFRILSEQPRPLLTGPSVGFVRAAQVALANLDQVAKALRLPSVVLTADQDAYVANDRVEEVCAAIEGCEMHPLVQSRHVLLHERDPVRDQVLDIIFQQLFH